MPEQTKITGGKVTFDLTVCPKQYESKRADVELTFTVGPDDDYEDVFKRASQAVVNRARVLVDLPELGKPKSEDVKTNHEFAAAPAGWKNPGDKTPKAETVAAAKATTNLFG